MPGKGGTGHSHTDYMDHQVDDDEIQRQRKAREKIEAVRKAAEHSFPTGDFADLLAEIERGRQE